MGLSSLALYIDELALWLIATFERILCLELSEKVIAMKIQFIPVIAMGFAESFNRVNNPDRILTNTALLGSPTELT